MPLFIDIHKHVPELSKDAVADAHQRDLAAQDQHGVKYLKYWFNETTGAVFCVVEAPHRTLQSACIGKRTG